LIVHAMRLSPLDGDVVGVSVEGTFPEGGELVMEWQPEVELGE
jgi:hypothetical protein